MSRSHIGIILLAAGSSYRMGQSKQLLEVEGEQLLLKSTRAALKSEAEQVLVVLGANESEHRKIIQELPVEIVINPEWKDGMGSSLKKGLHQLLSISPRLDAVILMVCDQPLLTPDHLNKLIQTFRQTKSPIVASFYSNTVGVPALFEKTLFEKLLSVENESGARKIIKQNMEMVKAIDFPEGAIDLDTRDEYQEFVGRKDKSDL